MFSIQEEAAWIFLSVQELPTNMLNLIRVSWSPFVAFARIFILRLLPSQKMWDKRRQ